MSWTEEYDIGDNFDGNFFVAPVDGLYMFYAQTMCNGNSQCWMYMKDSK